MEWSFQSDSPIEADLHVPAGVLEIETGPTEAVHVRLETESASAAAEELVASSEVTFDGRQLRVKVPERASTGFTFGSKNVVVRIPDLGISISRDIEVRCRVTVPAGSSVVCQTASADVSTFGVIDRFRATTASGDLVIDEVTGEASITTASGDVEARRVGGELRLKSASGDVRLGELAGDGGITVASGDIHVGEASSSLTLRTASGDISVDRLHRGKFSANTASGDIAVGVASGVGAKLDVTSVSGDMSCNVPVEEGSHPEAILDIVCRTVSGDVEIGAA